MPTTNLTAETITAHQINLLRTEAAQAGDLAQVEICDRALAGDPDADGADADSAIEDVIVAREACAVAINEAEAMA
jgi:hypothetical protein